MRVRRLGGVTVPALMMACLLAACGGSGSSGFDVTPGAFETPLIERAIAEQRCVDGAGDLLICPSGVPAPGPDGGMNAPGPSEVRVEAGLAGAVDCGVGGACTVPVAVVTEGLPEGAQQRVAVRTVGSELWQVGAPLELQPADGGDAVVTPVELTGGAVPGEEVQVAVLIFVPPLGAVPSEVHALSETGARYAFVLPPVTLVPGASS